MKAKGIRILDSENDIISVRLRDILNLIKNGDSFNWAILCSDVTPLKNEAHFIIAMEKQINESKNGVNTSWNDLQSFAKKIYQEIDLTVIACKDKKLIHRYSDEQEMYEICDISIQMIDSSYWEVFSNDEELINKLANKFNNTEFLAPDFER